MKDKQFCMSSYLAFRHIINPDKEFFLKMHHREIALLSDDKKIKVSSWYDVDNHLREILANETDEHSALLLSGGMDSGILAHYMPKGCITYTFKFDDDNCADERVNASYYAKQRGLDFRVIEITWEDIKRYAPIVMESKGAPVHSIEPQIYAAAMQAKSDGITKMIIGDAADYVFGGMDKLLSKDWTFDAFIKRYTYIEPNEVLVDPVGMQYFFEQFRREENSIDFMGIMNGECTLESYNSYHNAFHAAGLQYLDPYEDLLLEGGVNLKRIRKGESKYIIRELFTHCYPEYPIPEKIPMPRAVDTYFKNWSGPKRPEFIRNCTNGMTGNQRWLVFCLEWFLNIYDPMIE